MLQFQLVTYDPTQHLLFSLIKEKSRTEKAQNKTILSIGFKIQDTYLRDRFRKLLRECEAWTIHPLNTVLFVSQRQV